MITATIKPKRAANPRDNPRLVKRWIVITPAMEVPIDVQVYRASTIGQTQRYAVYADVYIRHGTLQASGTGKAGHASVPYDQQSAAIARAIDAAGVQLWDNGKRLFIDQDGEQGTIQALGAICAALGIAEYRIIN